MAAEPLPSQRHLFDLPDDVTYLNCAYMAPQLRAVTDAGAGGMARKARPWQISSTDFFTDVERLRERFATLVGGDADGVAVVPSASYGIATAAAQLRPGRGTELLVLEDQFPSNVYVWRELADDTGASVRTVPRPADGDWTGAVLDGVGEATAVVAVPPCHWTDGTVVDLVRVGAAARDVGAALVVDGTQAVGAVPFDVAAVRPDFLVVAAYKWLLGPYGIALLWARHDRRDGRPLEHNWQARAGSEDFARLVDYQDAFRAGARRYDVGENANFVLVPMAIAAIEQLLAWDVDRIAATCARLTTAIADTAGELGLAAPPAPTRSPHLLGLSLPAHREPGEVARTLRDAAVHVSVRGSSVRVSPHVYNDDGDVARLGDALRRAAG